MLVPTEDLVVVTSKAATTEQMIVNRPGLCPATLTPMRPEPVQRFSQAIERKGTGRSRAGLNKDIAVRHFATGCCWRIFAMRKSIIMIAVLAAAVGLSACNTVEGAGKDVSSAGKAVAKTARDVKN